jgi:hypothetical protein
LIFYKLKGPRNKLEIHHDKIKLVKSPWWSPFGPKDEKLEWANFEGQKCSFRFSTNMLMMDKIEKYVHKLILKNFQKRRVLTLIKNEEKQTETVALAA